MKLKKDERAAVFAKYGGRCAYCGDPLSSCWHADHLVPVVRNWGEEAKRVPMLAPENDRLENMMPACPSCNLDKTSMDLESWRKKLQRSCEVLKNNQPTYRHALRFGLVAETGAAVTFHFERIAESISTRRASPLSAVTCRCSRCIDEGKLMDVSGTFPLSAVMMVVCSECGNKRCPKAADHRFMCQRSNQPGQVGRLPTIAAGQWQPKR